MLHTKKNDSDRILFGKYSYKLILPFVCFLFSSNCVTHQPRDTQKLHKNSFLIIAHRGARHFAPENTMSAFHYAASKNWAFELDTMFCKSGELVVIHDETLERTTNGKGNVKDFTLDELKKLDAGSFFKESFKSETIPTLEEVLDTFGGKVIIDIEVKAGKDTAPEIARKTGEEVAKLITKKNLEEKVFVSSFNPLVLEKIKEINPTIFRAQLYSNFDDVDMAYYKKVALRNLLLNGKASPDILAPDYLLVDESYLKKYHELGYKVYPYTVNEPEKMAELLKSEVDGIITDRPDLLEELVKKK
ncbi:MAG: glycerophosphodiester phosphodiesterase [Leptospiraceae bacterium]|nr:glycerophosphodiester phosphodiesterase [Leptospiraceae bacterium]MCP5501179.1 glycerophosphodiester phosphodiesterase [Leptospiraceae bacterium]